MFIVSEQDFFLCMRGGAVSGGIGFLPGTLPPPGSGNNRSVTRPVLRHRMAERLCIRLSR
ncbi:hypothetical protein AOY87_11440 [Escherichia coli]|nr:hypothetical protein AOY87_11440 [Escherichia coli]